MIMLLALLTLLALGFLIAHIAGKPVPLWIAVFMLVLIAILQYVPPVMVR